MWQDSSCEHEYARAGPDSAGRRARRGPALCSPTASSCHTQRRRSPLICAESAGVSTAVSQQRAATTLNSRPALPRQHAYPAGPMLCKDCRPALGFKEADPGRRRIAGAHRRQRAGARVWVHRPLPPGGRPGCAWPNAAAPLPCTLTVCRLPARSAHRYAWVPGSSKIGGTLLCLLRSHLDGLRVQGCISAAV